MAARVVLGDAHNFGRRVSLHDGRVHKPRALLWEWLVLAAESPLRKLLETQAVHDGLERETFGFLPTLRFHGKARSGGEVEQVRLAPSPSAWSSACSAAYRPSCRA